jgi:hypothetical protein
MSEVLRNPVSLRNRVSGMYFIQLKTARIPRRTPAKEQVRLQQKAGYSKK